TLTSPIWVRTYVNELDLGRVRPGMPAEVRTDSARSKGYRGRVGFISPTAEFTPKSVETRELRTDLVYRLRVVVDAPDGGLRQGMPVPFTFEDKEVGPSSLPPSVPSVRPTRTSGFPGLTDVRRGEYDRQADPDRRGRTHRSRAGALADPIRRR